MDAPLPADHRLVLDPGTRLIDGGRVAVGGAPLRVLRLTAAGARLVAGWAAGAPVGSSPAAGRLARRLVEAAMAHPRPAAPLLGAADVTLVVPVRDQTAGLGALLASVAGPARPAAGRPPEPATVVVDDGSTDPAGVAAVAGRYGARLLRVDPPRGPAAARNLGWRLATTPAVAFLDADCTAATDWAGPLLAHLNDPAVGLAAPRVRPAPGAAPPWLVGYERARSALDLGDVAAPVRPRSRVPYVPAAALVARRAALDALGGFDESLTVGEDVDLVWRLADAGWSARYEPAAMVWHDTRAGLGAWLRQRYRYGTSAAPLERRHPGAAAPLTVSGWSAAAWGAAAAGHPAVGATLAAATTGLLVPRLRNLEHPWAEAVRLAGRGHVTAGRLAADAVRRAWWPAAVAAAVGSRRARRAVALAALVPPLTEWLAGDRALDPARWWALRLADDLAYGAGVWAGCLADRSLRALVPDLANWPGRSPAVEPAPV